MADEQNTPEVAAIVARIESWLDANHNKIDIDLSKNPMNLERHSETLFTGHQPQVAITLGFADKALNKNSTLEQLRASFNFVALDRLPTPGLDGVPSQWEIYPQTPVSSFSEGVTLEQYDASTQVLQVNVQTKFFAIMGSLPQDNRIACGRAPKGTYLQVRRDIQGSIKLRAKLVFT